MKLRSFLAGILAATLALPLAAAEPDLAELKKMAARFAPTPMEVDISHLSVGDRVALWKLILASRMLEELYLTQVWSGNAALWKTLQEDTSELGQARVKLFQIEKSPW